METWLFAQRPLFAAPTLRPTTFETPAPRDPHDPDLHLARPELTGSELTDSELTGPDPIGPSGVRKGLTRYA